MKVALFADGFVGNQITEFLINNYIGDLSCIVATSENKIISVAKEYSVPFLIFNNEQDVAELIGEDIELGILAWWPHIITRTLLNKAKLGFINTHPSYLPYNRGKHYNFWAIVEEAPFGVTLHRVDEGVDTGPIIAQKKIEYNWTDTGKTLYQRANDETINLFCQEYPKIRKGEFHLSPQNLNDGTFHHSSELSDASMISLDKKYTARELLNLLRAKTFDGYPGCWFCDNNVKYEVTINIQEKYK